MIISRSKRGNRILIAIPFVLIMVLACKPIDSGDEDNSIRHYQTLLQAVEDNYYSAFFLGSQLVQAKVPKYDKDLGKHNTFQPAKLIQQFNYIGLNNIFPAKKEGRLQQIWIGGRQASILYMGKYIYAMTTGNVVYRIPYTKTEIVDENNTTIESITIDCGTSMRLEGVYETNDGNFIVQCVNTDKSSEDYNTRFLYKITLMNGKQERVVFLFKCVKSSGKSICGVREHWSFKQYGSRILITPYGEGRTAQVWWSEDFGNCFKCIFNIADENTFVDTKPNGTGYGAKGIHPLPSQMIPPQNDDFWESVSSIGNGSRHIHSCCFDEEYERIWLVMGDDKYQATGIYWSDDFGRTWHRKSLFFNFSEIDKGRHTQMLQVVSLEKCVLFGTDGWGNGIFRYNRGGKEEELEIEYVFAWSENHDDLEGVANHTIVTQDGLVLMTFAPNSKDYAPTGGIVASDGYHFETVFIDTFNDNSLESMKIGWTTFLSIYQNDLYIRTKAKNELIIVEGFNNF